MAQFRVIKALRAAAVAEREKALMSLELLTENAVGIGDHTANDFFKDAQESLQRLVDADDQIDALDRYFGDSSEMLNG
jgi:hypothetical protein